MEMRMPASLSVVVKAKLVNRLVEVAPGLFLNADVTSFVGNVSHEGRPLLKNVPITPRRVAAEFIDENVVKERSARIVLRPFYSEYKKRMVPVPTAFSGTALSSDEPHELAKLALFELADMFDDVRLVFDSR